MPRRMLMDNGSPWGDAADQPWTQLTVWLLRVGVGVTHGRAYHPQTQGKEERFHRTLKAELLRERSFRDVSDCQVAFDPWWEVYNRERPHEALGLAVPASRFRVSGRSFPEVLGPVEYGPGMMVRKVQRDHGDISLHGRLVRIGKAFRGEPVGLRATAEEGVYTVHYCEHCLGSVDLREASQSKRHALSVKRSGYSPTSAVAGNESREE